MPVNSESTPPPKIGKIGPYTVFITPPSTPAAAANSPRKGSPATASPPPPPVFQTPAKPPSPVQAPPPVFQSPVKPPAPAPAPVQAPPSQFYSTKASGKSHSSFGFFWDAVAKVQDVHASLDEQVAYWFGLNQSKYQWALNDYYENNDPSVEKAKTLSGKAQDV